MTAPQWVEERAREIVEKCQGSHSRDIYGENLSLLRKLIAAALVEAEARGQEGRCCGHTEKCVCRAEGERAGREAPEVFTAQADLAELVAAAEAECFQSDRPRPRLMAALKPFREGKPK